MSFKDKQSSRKKEASDFRFVLYRQKNKSEKEHGLTVSRNFRSTPA